MGYFLKPVMESKVIDPGLHQAWAIKEATVQSKNLY
jgi:hypothetical protein